MAPTTLTYLTSALAIVGTAIAGTPIAGNLKSVGYYGSWASYSTLPPQQLQSSSLTHVLYSFAGINPDNGNATLSTDPDRDAKFAYPGDETSDPSQDLLGNIKQLFLHKKANRNFKTLLTFGGWGAAANLSTGLNTATKRSQFAYSAVQMMYSYGFDGIDIDWEYPETTDDINNLVDTCKQIRNMQNFYSAYANNYHFLLSLAVPAGYRRENFNLQAIGQYIDFINLMTYDFAGTWSTVTGYSSNLYASAFLPAATPSSIDSLLPYFIGTNGNNGIIPASKVLLGLPLYGHVFPNTAGQGQPYTQPAAGADTIAYSQIPLDSNVQTDTQAVAAFSYNKATKNFISFDNIATVSTKMDYVVKKLLGGAMLWSLDQDRAVTDANSIVSTVINKLKASGLENVQNNLAYPNSIFRNVRNQMGTQTLSTSVKKSSRIMRN